MKKLLTRLVTYRTDEEVDFSFRYFIAFFIIQTTVFMTIVYAVSSLFRHDFVTVQFQLSSRTVLAFLTMSLFMGLFEHLFHRYVLHRVTWKVLARYKHSHTEHHSLTQVQALSNTLDEKGQVEVRSQYPIITAGQIESSAFPGYALAAFWVIFSAIIIPAQMVLPDWPILTAGYLAVASSFALYEIIHAVEHLDYRYWKKGVERSKLVRAMYGFHLMHHADIGVNQAIGGFLGIPLWDWVLGTYFVPKELPLPGVRVTPASQVPPQPSRLIRWLDRVTAKRETRYKEYLKAKALSEHPRS